MATRRAKGDGAIYQRHDHPSCPPAVDGERPEHRCQGRWCGQVGMAAADGKRKRKTIYGRTEKEVRSKLREALQQQKERRLVVRSMTVEAWFRYWLDEVCVDQGLKANTMRSHRSKVEQYILPAIGGVRLDRLEPEHVRALYQKMRRDEKAEATIRQTHAILRRALEIAVRERKATVNVASLIDPPKTRTARRTPLSLEDARKVLRLADDRPRWWLALFMGMRQGEALALRWSDVDLAAGTITISRALVREKGKGLVYDTPKAEASVRVLPMPPSVRSRMSVERARRRDEPEDRLIFSTDGRPTDHRSDWQAWTDLLREARVEHVPLHAARNTAASLLEAAGVPERMAAEILGHAQVSTTHRYQSGDLERRLEAMTALERHYGFGAWAEHGPEGVGWDERALTSKHDDAQLGGDE